MRHPGLIRGHADFRRLWIGDGVSKLGSSVVVLVLPLLAATTLHASTWEVALLGTFGSLPFLLIGLPVGAWADRLRRRPILIAADLFRAALLAWIPVATVLDVLTIEQLFVIELLVGAGTVFFDVSLGAYLPALVGRSRLVEGNGRLEANRSVAYSAGPSLGGQLIGWLGAPLDHLLGRMNATSRFLAWATLPLGGVLGGALGTALGLRAALWLTAAGLLASSLWLILPAACRVRDLPPAPASPLRDHAGAPPAAPGARTGSE